MRTSELFGLLLLQLRFYRGRCHCNEGINIAFAVVAATSRPKVALPVGEKKSEMPKEFNKYRGLNS